MRSLRELGRCRGAKRAPRSKELGVVRGRQMAGKAPSGWEGDLLVKVRLFTPNFEKKSIGNAILTSKIIVIHSTDLVSRGLLRKAGF